MDAVDTKYDILQKFDSVWFFSSKEHQKEDPDQEKKQNNWWFQYQENEDKKFMTPVTSVLIKHCKLPIFTHIYSYLASNK